MKKNLELYIHIPFCVRKCEYCDFLSFSAEEEQQEEYVNALLKEIGYYGSRMKDYEVSTIYIGGGTPSWIRPEWIVQILQKAYQSFFVRQDAEISMECNPGTLVEHNLKMYREVGINRLSIGLQSADNEELKMLGRIHTYDQFLRSYEMAREAGFANINIDLISGLPFQTMDKFLDTALKVIRLRPEHVSVYSLIIEKGTPFYEKYKFDAVKQRAGMETEFLPSEDEEYKIFKATQIILNENGLLQYETSNFARKGYECYHNIGYWTRENYLGLGLGAASLIDNVRYTNTSDIYEYINGERRVEEIPISRKAQMEEFMFLGLRMNQGVSRLEFERAFHTSIEAIFRNPIEELKSQELMRAQGGYLFLTDKGRDLSNYCMSKFLLYE